MDTQEKSGGSWSFDSELVGLHHDMTLAGIPPGEWLGWSIDQTRLFNMERANRMPKRGTKARVRPRG